MSSLAVLTLAITANPEPPSTFRILRKGLNKTSKGSVTFDDQSQGLVLEAYADHGADLMIDYEHRSILTAGAPIDGGKAAGWFKPAVRDGELWATDVQWTAAATSALKAREYRYFSPALLHDSKGRVHKLVNIALTNLPATRGLQPLMASVLAGNAPECSAALSMLSGLGFSTARVAALGIDPNEFMRGYHDARAHIDNEQNGQQPVGGSKMDQEKKAMLEQMGFPISASDILAAEHLSLEELEVCRAFRSSPQVFLELKREEAGNSG